LTIQEHNGNNRIAYDYALAQHVVLLRRLPFQKVELTLDHDYYPAPAALSPTSLSSATNPAAAVVNWLPCRRA
jgi:hypothetical protein